MQRKSSRIKSRYKAVKRQKIVIWLQLICIFTVFITAYILWLDYRIRDEFEGKRWSIPARVYAQPLELYSGLDISAKEFSNELAELGYQISHSIRKAGEYQVSGNKIRFFRRPFDFWDGHEVSGRFEVSFKNNQIVNIRNIDHDIAISILRIEPQLIGKIYPTHNEDRIVITYDEIPSLLVDALIAVEDKNYLTHKGVDPKGIARAAWVNLKSSSMKQGGSTLTQQLVKNFFLTRERTLWRKINELIMSILLEYHYSKEEILTAYVNEIYLGQHGIRAIHGFGTAAEFYFSRPLNELALEEIALLVAIVRGASYYNPRMHHERAKERRNLVIELMQNEDFISESVASTAKNRGLKISRKPGWTSAKYPVFLELVRTQLLQEYDNHELRNDGLRIFTTLNPAVQRITEYILQEKISNLEKVKKIPGGTIQGAVVITERSTGEIISIVGGREHKYSGFNRAMNASRPIGSLIKPAVYLAALSDPQKFNVLTKLNDLPVNLKQDNGSNWTPKNYENTTHGKVPMFEALAKSYNLATVNLGLQIGIQRVIHILESLGVSVTIPAFPSLYLGALNLSPLEVTQMYQTIANDGFKIPLKTIREVLDQHGNPLKRFGLEFRQTIDPRYVFLIKYLMTKVVEIGTARSIKMDLSGDLPLAGKTGTTNELRDSWFAGFGDNLLAVVWLGRDDNKPAGMSGASGALKVWIALMKKIGIRPVILSAPEGIEWVKIYQDKKVIGDCPGSMNFPFMIESIPVETIKCNIIQSGEESRDNINLWRPW